MKRILEKYADIELAEDINPYLEEVEKNETELDHRIEHCSHHAPMSEETIKVINKMADEAYNKINSMNERDGIALSLLCALMSNPERYKYITKLVEDGLITQEEANEKNIKKAFRMADSFMRISKE